MKNSILAVLVLMIATCTGTSFAQPGPPVYLDGYHTTKKYGAKFVLGVAKGDSWNEASRQLNRNKTLNTNQTYVVKHGGSRYIFVYIWYIDSSAKNSVWYVKCDTNNGKGWLMNGRKVSDGDTFTFDPDGSNCIFKVTNANNNVWPRDTILVRWDY